MAIVDLDKLLEEQEPVQFSLFGKKYTIPDTSYGLSRDLDRIKKRIFSSASEEDNETILNLSTELIMRVVPEITKKTLEKAKGIQIRRINSLINEVLSGETLIEEREKEILYYRDKYKDEFRKKEQRTEENERK